MEKILTKENPTSGEISKSQNRYIDIEIKKGTVLMRLKKVDGSLLGIPSTIHGTIIKWDLIDFVSIEFISNDAVINYTW